MEGRKIVPHEKFEPFKDNVIIKAERVEKRIIMPTSNDKNQIMYKNMVVVGYGDLTRYVKVGDVVKLSEYNMSLAPEFLWGEEFEDDEGAPIKIDYLLIGEGFIKGRWSDKAVEEDMKNDQFIEDDSEFDDIDGEN